MKCIIVGIKPKDYVDKNGKQVKGYQFNMLADNMDVFGKVFKDCFVSADSPVYMNNYATFQDLNELQGREVNAEWDVETYGTKQVKRLINFELLDDFYDIVKREKRSDKKKEV